MTLQEHAMVYEALLAEADKARKAAEKARKEFDAAPFDYGGQSFARRKACAILQLREEQYRVAYAASGDYYAAYCAA